MLTSKSCRIPARRTSLPKRSRRSPWGMDTSYSWRCRIRSKRELGLNKSGSLICLDDTILWDLIRLAWAFVAPSLLVCWCWSQLNEIHRGRLTISGVKRCPGGSRNMTWWDRLCVTCKNQHTLFTHDLNGPVSAPIELVKVCKSIVPNKSPLWTFTSRQHRKFIPSHTRCRSI